METAIYNRAIKYCNAQVVGRISIFSGRHLASKVRDAPSEHLARGVYLACRASR